MREINHTSVETLLMDDRFYHWYCKTDPRIVQQWKEWIHADKKNERLTLEALQTLSLMLKSEKMPAVPEEQVLDNFNRLSRHIEARKISPNSSLN